MPQKQKKPRKPLIYQGLRGFCTLFPFDGDERMVDRHVAALRQKLGAAAQHIKSVYGAGYRLGGKE